ncbi:TPA: hypothetical protein ACQXK2_001863 [Streptococcus pneumoniae]
MPDLKYHSLFYHRPEKRLSTLLVSARDGPPKPCGVSKPID